MPRPKKTTEIAFPRTLYKPADINDPTATKCGNTNRGNAYHSVLVEDEEERKAARQMGYYDDFAKACAVDLNGPIPEEAGDEDNEAEEEINAKGARVSEKTSEQETIKPSKDELLDKGF